jgi:hypothetical protein
MEKGLPGTERLYVTRYQGSLSRLEACKTGIIEDFQFSGNSKNQGMDFLFRTKEKYCDKPVVWVKE